MDKCNSVIHFKHFMNFSAGAIPFIPPCSLSWLYELTNDSYFSAPSFSSFNSSTCRNGTNGGIAGGGTKDGVGGNGGIGTSGSTINGKKGTSANGHSV